MVSLRLAFRQTSCICFVQSSVEVKQIPRCLCSVTFLIVSPLRIIKGLLSCDFVENKISQDLSALNFTFHTLAQALIFAKSLFSCSPVSVGLRPQASNEVSSE